MNTHSSARPAGRLTGLLGALFACALAASMWLVLGSTSSAGAATAAYPPVNSCTVSVSTNTVTGGQSVTVIGSGFPANTAVQLSIESSPTSLGSVTTDSNGSFTATVTIPSGITGSGHYISALSGSESCSFGPLDVPSPSPSPSPSTSTNTSPSTQPSTSHAVQPTETHRPSPSKSVGGVTAARTPQSQPPSPLASTGFQTAAATTIAVILLAGGLTLVLLGRRRRHN